MTDKATHAQQPSFANSGVHRRNILAGGASLLALTTLAARDATAQQPAQTPQPASAGGRKPNILFIMGDDIGWFNVSAYNLGIMGYEFPPRAKAASFTVSDAMDKITAGLNKN